MNDFAAMKILKAEQKLTCEASSKLFRKRGEALQHGGDAAARDVLQENIHCVGLEVHVCRDVPHYVLVGEAAVQGQLVLETREMDLLIFSVEAIAKV